MGKEDFLLPRDGRFRKEQQPLPPLLKPFFTLPSSEDSASAAFAPARSLPPLSSSPSPTVSPSTKLKGSLTSATVCFLLFFFFFLLLLLLLLAISNMSSFINEEVQVVDGGGGGDDAGLRDCPTAVVE